MSAGSASHAARLGHPRDIQSSFLLGVHHHNPLIAGGLTALAENAGYRMLERFQQTPGIEMPTVVLLDIELLVREESCRQFSLKSLTVGRFIILTSPNQLANLGHLVPQTIRGIVSNKSPFAMIRHAIESVASGRQFIDPELHELWQRHEDYSDRSLTVRQLQIVRLVAEGQSSKQIAKRLGLSQSTIENHRSRILQRIGVNSSTELVLYAGRRGWV